MTVHLSPADLRADVRAGRWTSPTVAECPGFVQTNVLVLTADLVEDFRAVCAANPSVFPLVEEVTDPASIGVAAGADIRTDVAGYEVYRDGRLTSSPHEIVDEWEDGMTAFLLGCSFTANGALRRIGALDPGSHHNPVFVSNRSLRDAGRLTAPIAVSMRAVPDDLVAAAIAVTAPLTMAHGAPIHVGDPAELGIDDIGTPAWGTPYADMTGRTPVFWNCGVSAQLLVRTVQPRIAITHRPGHMFVTDLAAGSP